MSVKEKVDEILQATNVAQEMLDNLIEKYPGLTFTVKEGTELQAIVNINNLET